MATLDSIGFSERFRTVLDQIRIVAPVDLAVLVQGETGMGKEVIANAIHVRSKPFAKLNCTAIPVGLCRLA